MFRPPWQGGVTPEDIAELEAAAARGSDLRTAPANYGRQIPMVTDAQGAGVILRSTQLISARVNAPKQWLVTIAQAARPGQPTPWVASFDGAPYDNTAIFGAPVVPQQPGVDIGLLQCRVLWGAGGVRYAASFDYPAMGGVFGVTADTLDFNVALRNDGAQTAIAPDQIPVVGAFMVEGRPADPTPLRWLELATSIAVNAGASWSVKPFARKLRVTAPGSQKATLAWLIVSGVPGNTAVIENTTLVETTAGQGIDAVVDVPAQAEIAGVTGITHTGGLPQFYTLEWRMGLA